MKRIALPILLAGLLIAPGAFAADIAAPVYKAPVAVPIPFSWTGFYVGGFGGAGWGSEDPVDLNEYAGQGVANGVGHIWRYDMGTSFIGGGTVGFNYQYGWFVIGVEGEGGYIHQSGSGADPRSPGLDVVSAARLGDWYAIAAGRLGIAYDHFLFYGKGGVVWTDMSATITDSCTASPCGPRTISATGSGTSQASPVVGGGVEYAFTNNWSVKAEYLYWALDTHFLVSGVASNGNTYAWDHSFSGLHTIKLGLNYRF